MAIAETALRTPTIELGPDWIPEDTFAVRLGIIRVALGGWNVKKSAEYCGVDPGSWRNWERGKHVQDYEGVCRKIANATGCDITWLKAGGPCRSSWFVSSALLSGLPAVLGQGILFDADEPEIPERTLALVGAP